MLPKNPHTDRRPEAPSATISAAIYLVIGLSFTGLAAAQSDPAPSTADDRTWTRPLYLDVPEGSNGPCTRRAPCPLMSFIDGQLGPAQMIRRPGMPWRLWWLADGPMVRGTKVSAMGGQQGGGHMLTWTEMDSDRKPAAAKLSNGEVSVLLFGTAPLGHHLFSAQGRQLTRDVGVHLTASEVRRRGASQGADFSSGSGQITARKIKGLFRGPIAGGHTIEVDWEEDKQRRLIEERQVRASVLSDRDVLFQFDLWLRSTAGSQRFGGERAGLTVPLAIDDSTSPKAVGSERKATAPVPAAWAPSASDARVQDSEEQESDEQSPQAHWQSVEVLSGGTPYTVVLFGHPDNPPTERLSWNQGELRSDFSAYAGGGEQLRLSYRVWIVDGHDVPRGVLLEQADAFSGRSVEPTAEQLEARESSAKSPWG